MSKPDPVEKARVLAGKAAGDARAMHLLVADSEIDDEAIGLHAQQAIEKWLKSVVVISGLDFKPGHDLGQQLQILAAGGIEGPPGAAQLDELSIYASTMRYEDLLDTEPLDRVRVVELVDGVGAWARSFLPADT